MNARSRRIERNFGNACDFADGRQQVVYEDADGLQFVIDDEGQAVYGVWILADEPETVTDARRVVVSLR